MAVKSDRPPLSGPQGKALRAIRNLLMHQGRAPSVRELAETLGYRSPRSAAVLIEQLADAGYVARRENGELRLLRMPPEDAAHARTVDVPLVGSAPCGAPLLAVENVEAMVPVSDRLARPPYRYFLLRCVGDSMAEAGLTDGALVLVRQQPAAENGQVVVALIDEEATIKEFHRDCEVISLRPRSANPKHRTIIVTGDFAVQGVVVTVFRDR